MDRICGQDSLKKKIEMRNITHKTRDNGDAVALWLLNCKTVAFSANASDVGGIRTKGLERVETVRKAGERRYREEKTVWLESALIDLG